MKIAVAFFGIARSLKFTRISIENQILSPLRASGEAKIFGHFYDLLRIDNPRSGESSELDRSQHALIDFDDLALDRPDECLSRFDMQAILAARDPYDDDYKSVKNLLHQLHSLDKVTIRIQETYEPDVVIFARPDLVYHDSFAGTVERASRSTAGEVFLPPWQGYSGYNDRFAVCNRESYVAYGARANLVDAYVGSRRPLYAEMFLRFALGKAQVKISRLDITASRVRVDGRVEDEVFADTSFIVSAFLRHKFALKHWLKRPLGTVTVR